MRSHPGQSQQRSGGASAARFWLGEYPLNEGFLVLGMA